VLFETKLTLACASVISAVEMIGGWDTLTIMNQEQQIKALAELDGMYYFTADATRHYPGFWQNDKGQAFHELHYLTSYDAIIPLIQKQDKATQTRMVVAMTVAQNNTARFFDFLNRTPAQLGEALLRATGKWIE